MTWLLLFAAAVASLKPGELRTFRDWTVGCDNGRACHATSLMPESGDWDQSLTMSVERGPEAGAQPVITLLAGADKSYRLRTARGRILRLVAGKPDFRVDPRDVPAALTALRGDSKLTVEDARGSRLGEISLAGVTAAMLHMDDRQMRVGTVTALVRPGGKPASAVPPPPPLPVVRSGARKGARPFAIPASRISELRKRHECEPDEPGRTGYDATQETLDSSRVLLLLGCGAGAYNFSSIAFIATRRGNIMDVSPAKFDISPSSGPGQPMLINAEWDAGHGILGSFAKARGLGDCGTFADYAWDGQRFRLVERREMDECRGSMDYITTWRMRVVPR